MTETLPATLPGCPASDWLVWDEFCQGLEVPEGRTGKLPVESDSMGQGDLKYPLKQAPDITLMHPTHRV